jgi:hypothetical protein
VHRIWTYKARPRVPALEHTNITVHVAVISQISPYPTFDPTATINAPCPGLSVGEILPDAATGTLFRLNVTGLASANAYTNCLFRLFYYNLAAQAGNISDIVEGVREVTITVYSPTVSALSTVAGTSVLVNVTSDAACVGGCPPPLLHVGPEQPFPVASALPTAWPPYSGADGGEDGGNSSALSPSNGAATMALHAVSAAGVMAGLTALTAARLE